MTKLQYQQQAMRDRMAAGNPQTYTRRSRGPKLPPPVKVQKPARAPRPPRDISAPVAFAATPVTELMVPMHCGVYLFYEADRFYIGESLDVLGRLVKHRSDARTRSESGMDTPRAFLLMEINHRRSCSLSTNKLTRLTAEDRFIAAALALGLELTNKVSPVAIERARGLNLDCETERLKAALALIRS